MVNVALSRGELRVAEELKDGHHVARVAERPQGVGVPKAVRADALSVDACSTHQPADEVSHGTSREVPVPVSQGNLAIDAQRGEIVAAPVLNRRFEDSSVDKVQANTYATEPP